MSVIGLFLSTIHTHCVIGIQLIIKMDLGNGYQARPLAVAVKKLLPLVVRSREVGILRGGR